MTVLLETICGSRLYGTHHKDSDYDYYRVILDGRTRQKIVGEEDFINVSFTDYLKLVEKGVPQAMEALYSPLKTVDPRYDAFFKALRPTTQLYSTYRRTIKFMNTNKKNISFDQLTFKQKLHKLRLTHNLNQFAEIGAMNPILEPELITLFREIAGKSEEEYYEFLNDYSLIELDL